MAAVESSAVFELRPMNLADMLDAVIRLFRHNFGILVRIAAVIHVPLGVIYIASMAAAVGGIDTEEPPTDLPWATMIGGAGVILYVILMMLAMPIMQGAMAKAVAQRHLGEEAGLGDAYRFALRRWFPLLLTTIIYGLISLVVVAIPLIPVAVLAGSSIILGDSSAPEFGIAAIIAGLLGMLVAAGLSIWTTFKLLFAPLVVVLEDQSPMDALVRSWRLTDGHFIRVAATIFVISLLAGVLTYMVAIPVQVAGALLQFVSPAGGQALAGTGMVVAQVFLQPIQIIATVLVYYDLRMRKEGFDLVMMAQAIGEPELAVRTPEGVARPATALYGMEAPPLPPLPPETAAPVYPPPPAAPTAAPPMPGTNGVPDEPGHTDQLP